MILGRVHHKSIRLTPCGRHRKDVIYDISKEKDVGKFIEEACRIIDEFQKGISDVIALEHFVGEKGQETRKDGESLFYCEKNNEKWDFKIGNKKMFSFNDSDELMKKAIDLKRKGEI